MSSNDKNDNLSCAVPNSMQDTSQTQPQVMQPIQMHYPHINFIGHQFFFRPLALYDTSTMTLEPITAQPTADIQSFQQYPIVPPVFTTILCPTINNNNLQTPTNNAAPIENSSVGQPSGQASGQVSLSPVPAELSDQVCSPTKTKTEEATAESTSNTSPTYVTQTYTQAPALKLQTTSMLMDDKPLPKTGKTRKRKNVKCRCPNCKVDSVYQRRFPNGSLQHLCHVVGCRKVFNRPSLLKNHLRCHGSKKTVFCAHCDKGYTRKSQLRVHLKSHENPEPKDESKVGNNIQLQYNKMRLQYWCRFPDCGRAFGDPSTLKRHEDWHSADKNMCDKEYSPKNEVIIREKIMHTNVERKKSKGKRSICNAVKQTQKERVICRFEGCGRVYSSVSNMKAHLKLHNNDRLYPCTDCGKKFTFECYLRKHQRSHRDKKV